MEILNNSPAFCLSVSDNSCIHVGLRAGDVVMCDMKTAPARFLIGVWDGLAHICTNVGGQLFDETTHSFAPEEAEIWGRALYLTRNLAPFSETETPTQL